MNRAFVISARIVWKTKRFGGFSRIVAVGGEQPDARSQSQSLNDFPNVKRFTLCRQQNRLTTRETSYTDPIANRNRLEYQVISCNAESSGKTSDPDSAQCACTNPSQYPPMSNRGGGIVWSPWRGRKTQTTRLSCRRLRRRRRGSPSPHLSHIKQGATILRKSSANP